MNPLTIVQARMSSRRLPGKTLAQIGPRNTLEWVLHQLGRCKVDLGEVVVATSTDPADDPIVKACDRAAVNWFRGDPDDVLGRFVQCHDLHGGDPIVRVTADCPFLDPELLDAVVAKLAGEHWDYVGVKGAPAGTHQEAFTAHALKTADFSTGDPYDREHVVPWMVRHLRCGYVLTYRNGRVPVELNTADDLERLRRMVA